MRVFRAALALGLCGGTPLFAQERGTVAFVNANVLPMDRDTVLAGQTVLIRDGIIQQVGPSNRVRIPSGTTRVDAGGKYLMPGLPFFSYTLAPIQATLIAPMLGVRLLPSLFSHVG